MEDRCIVCGDIVPEGTHVCPTCVIANSPAPCRNCESRQEGCHVYCKTYLTYYNACRRKNAIKLRHNGEIGYFVDKENKLDKIGRSYRKGDK